MIYKTETICDEYYRNYKIEYSRCGEDWEAWIWENEEDAEPVFLRIAISLEEVKEKAYAVIDDIQELVSALESGITKLNKIRKRDVDVIRRWLSN